MQQAINEFLRITDGIAMSDVIGWFLAAIGAVVVYKVIDNMQTSMERHGMLKDVENSFSEIYNSIIAKSCNCESDNKLEDVMVRSVLHDDGCWEIVKPKDGAGKYGNVIKIVDHQRYIQIRNKEGNPPKSIYHNEWISTQALHEITLHCRRIEKMFKDGIVKRIDLSDMFREIVPLGMSGRVEFFEAYYDDYDADCIGYLVLQTIVSCNKYHNDGIVKAFMAYYNSNPNIHTHFVESRRIRRIRDRRAVKKFEEISLKYKH